MRPTTFHVGGVVYWVMRVRNPDTMTLKDADSLPTVAVRKNGASTADSVTITKRAATTGIYDCSYNPAGEVEGDSYTIEESAIVTGTTTAQATYTQSWTLRTLAVERGTDGANTIAPATPANVTASTSTIAALLPVALVGGRIDASVGAVAANAINAASIAANAIGTATFAAGTTIPRVTLADTTTTNTDMRGTDGANTVAPTNLSALQVRTELATELARIDASVSSRSTYAGGAVASVTAAVALDAASVTAVQSGLATPADINAQMLDVLSVDTFAELSSPPAATSSLKDKLTWMFMWFRNKSTETATERKLFADDTTTVISTEAVSDNGTTFTKNEAS